MRKHKEGEDMNYTISNEKLTLVVSSKGGEFQSVKDAEGQEYLWQGDAATWIRQRTESISLYRSNDRKKL